MKLLATLQLNAYAYLRYGRSYPEELAVNEAKKIVALSCTAALFILSVCGAIVLAAFDSPPEQPGIATETIIKGGLVALFLVVSAYLYRRIGHVRFDYSQLTEGDARRRIALHYATGLSMGVGTVLLVVASGALNGYIRSLL